MPRSLPLWPRYFVWTLVPILLYGAYPMNAAPHVIWSYVWRDDGQGYAPFAHRHYLRCTYVGPYGTFSEDAVDGKCSWITLRKRPAHARDKE